MRHKLEKVYAYLDDLTVTGSNAEEHDRNLRRLLEAAEKDGLTFNDSKSTIKVSCLDLLGYRVSHGQIKPDPSRLQPLLDIKPPATAKQLKRANGLFAYYAKWI